MSDITDIQASPKAIEMMAEISDLLALGTHQDTARIAIVLAATEGVNPDLRARPDRGQSWKGSQLGSDGLIVRALMAIRPDLEGDLSERPMRVLESLIEPGVDLLHEKLSRAEIETLADLLPQDSPD